MKPVAEFIGFVAGEMPVFKWLGEPLPVGTKFYALPVLDRAPAWPERTYVSAAPVQAQPAPIDIAAAVDAAMVEMANIAPPLRRSECQRLIRAALAATQPAAAPADATPWDKFPGWLIDHHEGDMISEEGLQGALSDMLAHLEIAALAEDPNWMGTIPHAFQNVAQGEPSLEDKAGRLADTMGGCQAAAQGEREAFDAVLAKPLLADQGEYCLARAYSDGHPYTFLATKWAYRGYQQGRADERAAQVPPVAVQHDIVEYQTRMRPTWRDEGEGWSDWERCTKGSYEDALRLGVYNDWQYEARALCVAAPSPQPAIQAGEWISVADQLPPDGDVVLAWNGDQVVIERWMERHEAPVEWSTATVPVGPGWDDHEFEDITHWMPLPAAPQQADGGGA